MFHAVTSRCRSKSGPYPARPGAGQAKNADGLFLSAEDVVVFFMLHSHNSSLSKEKTLRASRMMLVSLKRNTACWTRECLLTCFPSRFADAVLVYPHSLSNKDCTGLVWRHFLNHHECKRSLGSFDLIFYVPKLIHPSTKGVLRNGHWDWTVRGTV